MAKDTNDKPLEKPQAAPAPAPVSDFVKVTLDRTYVHHGEFYGPGEVEVPADVALDFNKAQERAAQADQTAVDRAKAIDDAEDARREAEANKDKAVS